MKRETFFNYSPYKNSSKEEIEKTIEETLKKAISEIKDIVDNPDRPIKIRLST